MDQAAFWLLITTFLLLAGQWVVFAVVEYLLGEYLLIRWRRHMSRAVRRRLAGGRPALPHPVPGRDRGQPRPAHLRGHPHLCRPAPSRSPSTLFSTFLTLAAFVQLLWDLSARFRTEDSGAVHAAGSPRPGISRLGLPRLRGLRHGGRAPDRPAADLEELQQGAHRGRFPLRHGADARIQRAGGAARRRAAPSARRCSGATTGRSTRR